MTLHIKHAVVENFKRIKEVDVSDMGDVVVIGGRNAQGKSSFIDAIWNTLGGKQRAVTQPVRDGEAKASATITIEDTASGTGLVVTRTWKAGGASKLTVKPLGSSAELSKGQHVLDDLIGAFAFDPMAFLDQDKKAQRDTLADLIGLDLTELDAEYKHAYDARRAAGVEVRRLGGSLATLERPAANLPEEFVSVTALSQERSTREHWERARDLAEVEWRRVNEEIRRLTAQLETHVSDGKHAAEELEKLRPAEDIHRDIANAESTNQAIHAAQTYRERKAELKEAEKLHAKLDADVDMAVEEKRKALERANLPIDGLAFDDEQVLYNDVPLSQASAAEQRRVSMALAMRLNPELKVICLKDASLIDEEGQQQIREMAAENDFQLILELVGNPGGETIVIEDGEVA